MIERKKPRVNKSLYVNVDDLLVLLECIRRCNPKWAAVIDEIVNIIYDLKWVEVK